MSDRLVRALLWLYPPAFRRRHAGDIVAEVRARHARARLEGAAGSRFWLRTGGDLVSTSLRAWGSVPASRRPGAGRARGDGAGDAGNGHIPASPPPRPFAGAMADLHQAFRGLVRRPGFALLAAATLGIGIGLTTAMFSIFDAFLLRGLPVPEPHQVVAVRRTDPRGGPDSRVGGSLDYYLDLRDRQTTFAGLAAWTFRGEVTVADDTGVPVKASAFGMTSNAFETLRVEPVLGRGFSAADAAPGAAPVVLVSYPLWRTRFAADPAAVGRTVRIDGVPRVIVGVMPEGFEFPWNARLWVPITIDPAAGRGQAGNPWVFGRLRPGVGIDAARAEIRGLVEQLAQEFPETHGDVNMAVNEWLTDFWGNGLRFAGWAALATVSLVLLLACLNVSNLLLGRAVVARRELAVRAALGAGRARLVRQMFFDAFAIAALGTVMGVGIAALAMRAFDAAMSAVPFGRPWYISVSIHPRVLLFSLAALTTAALAAGVIPALQVSRTRPEIGLRDPSQAASSLRIGRANRTLVVAQVGLASTLLFVGGLFGRAMTSAHGFGLEMDPGHLFVAEIALPADRYPDVGARGRFWSELLADLEADPDLGAVAGDGDIALSTGLPLVTMGTTDFRAAGAAAQTVRAPRARLAMVTSAYFDATRTVLLRGRGFLDTDDEQAPPVVLVSQSLVRRYFGDEDGLGRRLLLPEGDGVGRRLALPADDGAVEATIVGVLAEVPADAPNGEGRTPVDAIFVPLAQRPPSWARLIIRTTGDPLAIAGFVRARVAQLDDDLAVTGINTLRRELADSSYFITAFGSLFLVFGAAALLLGAVGLYGVMSFAVQQRTREVGIRVALGARPAAVARMMLRQGLVRVGVGLAGGLAVGVGLARLVPSLPYGVSPTDGAVIGGITVVLVVTGGLAAWLPARRAARVDPLEAIGAE